jgi:tRNA(Ile2)-agmatinylcytidine synthase
MSGWIELHLGFDDTDSRTRGMCTTYLGFRLLKELLARQGIRLLDYPWLIRLNPNVPFKTRGNGAVSLHLLISRDLWDPEELIREASEILEDLAILEDPGTHPGMVAIVGSVPEELRRLYWKAVRSVVKLDSVKRILEKFSGASYRGWKQGRGIVGATAALGADLSKDWTYELLAYRAIKDGPRQRRIDPESVQFMDQMTFPETFDNLDPETGSILIAPRGPDPVLCGIRGETSEIVERAFRLLRIQEPVEGYWIFRTNQATDHHLVRKRVADVARYESVILVGRVKDYPQTLPGGHVKFSLEDSSGTIDCVAYRETGKAFRNVVRSLAPGDLVEVYGSIASHERTVNLEKLRILRLARIYKEMNPVCPRCGARMHSMGAGKGFKCRRCGYRDPNAKKIKVEIPRSIAPGLYDVTPDARRHISKPVLRFGREKFLQEAEK